MIDPVDADMTVALFTDTLADAVDPPAVLREWSNRYPELAEEFAATAAERHFGESALDVGTVASQAEMMSRLTAEASKSIGTADASAAKSKASRATDLAGAAAAAGLAYPAELARRLRLPASILERIVSRRIPARTLPSVLVDQMAAALASTRADVLSWLGIASAVSGNRVAALVVSEEKAPYGTPSTFADAIANALDVDETDRVYWASVMGVSRTVGEE